MDVVDILLAHQIKPSVQRLAIMEYLMAHMTHPNVEEIYAALSPSMPTLSKTTVYNTLKTLVDHGAVRMLSIDERHTRYDYRTDPHAHFLCRQCGKVYDLPFNAEVLRLMPLDTHGHEVEEMHYYLRGLCKQCKEDDCYSNTNQEITS